MFLLNILNPQMVESLYGVDLRNIHQNNKQKGTSLLEDNIEG